MPQSDSDSESGLPQIISFSTSASLAKGHRHALRSFHAVEKRKVKERNRRHDERLKAQANERRRVTATTGKSRHHAVNHEAETGDDESGSDLDPRLHWRMTRAMGNAEEEEMEESDGANASADEWGGINVAGGGGQDVEMSRGEGTEETEGKSRNADPDPSEGESDDDGLGILHSQAPSSKYLPDHVFITARPKLNPENDVRISQTTPKARSTRKRHLVRARGKDVVVGTRTVRTLSSSPASVHVQSQGTTLRPAHINKFLTNALRLGGKDKKISPRVNASRWERRPSHLGVMKRAVGAPVTGFARTTQH